MALLRLLLVGVLIFFIVVAIRKLSKDSPISSATAPTSSQTNPAVTETPKPTAARHPETKSPPAQEVPTTQEPVPTARRIPIAPTSGLPNGLLFTVEQCVRSAEQIRCWGLGTNRAEIAANLQLEDSRAIDDQGRTVPIVGGEIAYDDGSDHQKLLPNVPTRVNVLLNDPYPSVKTVNIELHIYFGNEFNPINYHNLFFRDVPVQ